MMLIHIILTKAFQWQIYIFQNHSRDTSSSTISFDRPDHTGHVSNVPEKVVIFIMLQKQFLVHIKLYDSLKPVSLIKYKHDNRVY